MTHRYGLRQLSSNVRQCRRACHQQQNPFLLKLWSLRLFLCWCIVHLYAAFVWAASGGDFVWRFLVIGYWGVVSRRRFWQAVPGDDCVWRFCMGDLPSRPYIVTH